MKSQKRKPKDDGENGAKQKSVLLVDDHPLVREGISALIRATSDLRVAGEAKSAAEALAALAANVPDLLLLDISLPGGDGIELLKDLRVRYPRMCVLVLSMHEESAYAERMLRAGANGYIMKQESGSVVIDAIRAVLRGELYVSAALAVRMVKLFVSNKQGKDAQSGVDRLSDRELQVFTCIGKGLATREIAEQLHLSVETIQTYRAYIKRKLGVKNATGLVQQATHWVESGTSKPSPDQH